jgi:hypothetical protein
MNVEIGPVAAQFPENEYLFLCSAEHNVLFVALPLFIIIFVFCNTEGNRYDEEETWWEMERGETEIAKRWR